MGGPPLQPRALLPGRRSAKKAAGTARVLRGAPPPCTPTQELPGGGPFSRGRKGPFSTCRFHARSPARSRPAGAGARLPGDGVCRSSSRSSGPPFRVWPRRVDRRAPRITQASPAWSQLAPLARARVAPFARTALAPLGRTSPDPFARTRVDPLGRSSGGSFSPNHDRRRWRSRTWVAWPRWRRSKPGWLRSASCGRRPHGDGSRRLRRR